MELYLNTYIPPTLASTIYTYIGWYHLRNCEKVPMCVWEKLCNELCENDIFQYKINEYWGESYLNYKKVLSAKDFLLHFINYLVLSKYLYDIPPLLWKDKSFVILKLKKRPSLFNSPCHSFQLDHEVIFKVIETNPHILQDVNMIIRQNREFMLRAIKINPIASIYADIDDIATTNSDVTLNAVVNDPTLFFYVHNNLRYDRNFILQLVMRNPSLFYSISDTFKYDPEIALAAMKYIPDVTKYIDPILKQDRRFILKALKVCSGRILDFVHPNLKADVKFIVDAIKVNPSVDLWVP